jgi:two-component system LytT family response regulator
MNTTPLLSETKNRCIIVDDEESGRITLRYALSNTSEWEIAAEFNQVKSAREFLEQNSVDVVFLDIQMPLENGISLARSISQMTQPPLIIFVTAYNAHAVEAFELHALDYLLKPFNQIRFAEAIKHAQEILTQRRGYAQALQTYVESESHSKDQEPVYLEQVVVRSVGEMECVRIAQIQWIASASNYVELRLEKRTVLHRMTLSNLEKHLDPKQFMRVHRTVIVRREQMQQVSVTGDGVYELKLICGAAVPVSERHIDAVRAVFNH